MKVLVTGATGFIGQHVVRFLLQQNYQVIATSLNQIKAEEIDWYAAVLYRPFDISQPNLYLKVDQNLFQYFNEPDHVIHLAWEGVSDCKGMFHIEKNLMQHYSFLKTLVIEGLKKLTVTGTCLEYGMKTGRLSENQLPEPHVPYAIAKDALRRFLNELQKQHPFSLQWIRLFYIYGNGQHSKSLMAQLHQAIQVKDSIFNMSGGEQVRDYLPVEKVAQYLVQLAKCASSNEIYNCCSGKPITVKQLVEKEIKNLNANIQLNLGYYPYKDYEPMRFWGDNEKLFKTLHFL